MNDHPHELLDEEGQHISWEKENFGDTWEQDEEGD